MCHHTRALLQKLGNTKAVQPRDIFASSPAWFPPTAPDTYFFLPGMWQKHCVPHHSLSLRNGGARESWQQLAAHHISDTPSPFLPWMIHLDAVCKVEKEADSGTDGFQSRWVCSLHGRFKTSTAPLAQPSLCQAYARGGFGPP